MSPPLYLKTALSTWSCETDLPRLFNRILAADLNEELRLIGHVIAIPKMVNSTPQLLSINGRDRILVNAMIGSLSPLYPAILISGRGSSERSTNRYL
jgi:hypothetical protein